MYSYSHFVGAEQGGIISNTLLIHLLSFFQILLSTLALLFGLSLLSFSFVLRSVPLFPHRHFSWNLGENRDCTFSVSVFFGLHPWHMEIPRLGVESELQLPAYTTVPQDLSCCFNLHHSSRQCQIFNPLSEARDQTHILMDTTWVRYH